MEGAEVHVMEGADKAFSQTFGNYILHGIEEVHLPDPVSWWPQTIGWKVLGLLALILLSYGIYRQIKIWWRNRYRREALKQLASLEASAADWQSVVRQLPTLLKLVALQVYPRSDIAVLSGPSWLYFLDAQSSGVSFCDKAGEQLLVVAYQAEEHWMLDEADARELISRVRFWISNHQALMLSPPSVKGASRA